MRYLCAPLQNPVTACCIEEALAASFLNGGDDTFFFGTTTDVGIGITQPVPISVLNTDYINKNNIYVVRSSIYQCPAIAQHSVGIFRMQRLLNGNPPTSKWIQEFEVKALQQDFWTYVFNSLNISSKEKDVFSMIETNSEKQLSCFLFETGSGVFFTSGGLFLLPLYIDFDSCKTSSDIVQQNIGSNIPFGFTSGTKYISITELVPSCTIDILSNIFQEYLRNIYGDDLTIATDFTDNEKSIMSSLIPKYSDPDWVTYGTSV